MGRIYLPFEDVAMRPTFGPMLPGTPHPTLVGNPHLRGGPFVALPGSGMEAAGAGTNLVLDPQFSDVANWPALLTPTTREVGAQFAMDQGEFFGGLHLVMDVADEGVTQNITIITATDYAASVWLYVISGTLELEVDKGDGTLFSCGTYSAQKQWYRIEGTFTSTGTAGKLRCQSSGGAAEGYFWMPQWETGTYARPACVGAQPASCIYTPSPISNAQTAWSSVSIVTPDWDYDAASGVTRRVWTLYEDADSYVEVRYNETDDKWYLAAKETSEATVASAASTHSRGDKIHLVVTCDGYNAYLYVNGVQSSALVMKAVNTITNLIIGAQTTAAANPLNGVVDDFAFIEGAAIPSFRAAELYRAFLRGVPLHGILESLA